MRRVAIYLNFNGNTEEAFIFYKSVFNNEFSALVRFGDMPNLGNIPDDLKHKIMHVALPIHENVTIMATDALEAMGQKLIAGNNTSIYLELDSRKDADEYYRKLSADGKIMIPLAVAPWGAYFGACADKFGTQWMISTPENQ